jgi:hypothetical protein
MWVVSRQLDRLQVIRPSGVSPGGMDAARGEWPYCVFNIADRDDFLGEQWATEHSANGGWPSPDDLHIKYGDSI